MLEASVAQYTLSVRARVPSFTMLAMAPPLTHLAIRCADLDRSVAFSRDWGGLEVLHRRADPGADGLGLIRVAWIGTRREDGASPAFFIVLLEPHAAPGPTSLFDHLGFAVATRAEVDAYAVRGKTAGILHWPAEDHGAVVGYLCAVKDPDGNVVEFSCGQELAFS
mgnify:CR=1 FL=1